MAVLGIDTSNYTSSVALVSDNEIIVDNRNLLDVKKGELGLRQSDALYQHWENLPGLLKDALKDKPEAVVVSSRPRPVEGSYMPVFNAGHNIGRILADAYNVPLFELSHQEGHILAAAYGNDIDFSRPIVCAHLSGGTLELIKIENGKYEIVGNTKDISYGQLIDRIGVAMGLGFPAGKEMDKMALEADISGMKSPFTAIFTDGSDVNISGIETQIQREIRNNELSKEVIAAFTMKAIADSLTRIIDNTGVSQVLLTGGVSSSDYLRQYLKSKNYKFGRRDLCSDNAVGLALSKGVLPWQ